jgi:PAS domain S-box-containing protein
MLAVGLWVSISCLLLEPIASAQTTLALLPSQVNTSYSLIVFGVFLILLEMALIFGLLWQRRTRRKVEAELAITHDRLHLAVEAGKCVGWDWDVKTGRDLWFGDLQTVFGIESDTFSGRVEDFHRRVYPDDQKLVAKAVADARQSRKPYIAEFRVIRNDGTLRWIGARGQFQYAKDGTAERMVGMAVDITERKKSEEALASLSGHLIEAQDEERKRIAREIHDDYQQRLAMVAIDLEEIAGNIGRSNFDAASRMRKLWNDVGELAADLHSLSHQLHSSALENLGLVAGIKAFCDEFSNQQALQVDFTYDNVPHEIPTEVNLCLFRITQESLRNVKRHSDSNRAEVRLEGIGDRLHLSILDRGKGFDHHVQSIQGGIGIRSMEERLRLVGGRLEVHSKVKEGTRIEASVPVATSRDLGQAMSA